MSLLYMFGRSGWFSVGLVGVVLGACLLVGGYVADNYVEWLDTWHDTPFGRVRDYRMSYRDYAFPLYAVGGCLLLMGIVSLYNDYEIRKLKEIKQKKEPEVLNFLAKFLF